MLSALLSLQSFHQNPAFKDFHQSPAHYPQKEEEEELMEEEVFPKFPIC